MNKARAFGWARHSLGPHRSTRMAAAAALSARAGATLSRSVRSGQSGQSGRAHGRTHHRRLAPGANDLSQSLSAPWLALPLFFRGNPFASGSRVSLRSASSSGSVELHRAAPLQTMAPATEDSTLRVEVAPKPEEEDEADDAEEEEEAPMTPPDEPTRFIDVQPLGPDPLVRRPFPSQPVAPGCLALRKARVQGRISCWSSTQVPSSAGTRPV
jgi:hypothetical protein